MKDLAHRGIAQILGRQRVLRLRNLLRTSPAGCPCLRLRPALSGSLPLAVARNQTECNNRDESWCLCHRRRFTIKSLSKSLFKSDASIPLRSSPVTYALKSPSLLSSCIFCVLAAAGAANSQTPATPQAVTPTADQDHQNMMDQLGIKALRPGPSGDEKAPNHANYDESQANPYPALPDPLTLNDGRKVTTPEMWRNTRRPELVEMFSNYVYGRVPVNVPTVKWTVTAMDHEMIGFTPVIAKDLVGEVDNSSFPVIGVRIHMTLVTPANAKGPVPVLMMFGRAGFPYPNEPRGEDLDRINKAMKALLVKQDPSLNDVIAQHPAWQPVKETPFQFPQLNEEAACPTP